MLELVIKSNKTNTYELKVRSVLREIVYYCSDLEGAERYFNCSLKEMKRETTAKIEQLYRAELKESCLTVSHLNIHSEPDRVVGVIRIKT